MSLEEAALIEPVSVAVHALRRAELGLGSLAARQVVVLVAGTIGNLVALVARALSASAVLISDPSEFRLEMARGCGISFTVNPARESLEKGLFRHLGPDKADLIVE
jgi:threonine dehydrogenase-like Zn-dependent dehydrogenase